VGRRGLIVLALLAAGCGPTPPQAPGPQAHRLNKALSTFSSACAHAAEIQEFTNDARAMTITEHQAQKQVPQLARIWRQNPDWIFQGKTVAELVQMSVGYLDECGLHQAARRLRAATSSK
jgi:hypothetical protein